MTAAGTTPIELPADFVLDLESERYADISALTALGLDFLKQELIRRGLKSGGTLVERATRLHAVRNIPVDKIPAKLRAATK